MARVLPLVFLIAAIALVGVSPADAILVALTEEQVAAAVAHGAATFEQYKKEGGRAVDDLEPEYVVDLGEDVGRALLYTEFSTLALEARRYLAIGRPFGKPQQEIVLAPRRGKIEFFVVVVGAAKDFLMNYKVSLVDRAGSHNPISWDVSRTVPKPGATGRYVASGYYTFPGGDLERDQPATLVVRSPDGEELRFEFDFARLR